MGVFDVEFAEEVAGSAGDGNYPTRFGAQQRRHELGGEGEVAEMVGPELQLEPISGLQPGRSHDAGVVDEDVDPVVGVDHLGGKALDRVERTQVELADLERSVRDV